MERARVVIRFAAGTLEQIEGVEDLLDLDEAIAEAIGNPDDDEDAEHVVGTSEAWDDGFVFADVATNDPRALFRLVRPWLERNLILDTLVVALRSPRGPVEVMHPPDFRGPFEPPL
jgi:hypothetical protein